jgi:hypothetical protein
VTVCRRDKRDGVSAEPERWQAVASVEDGELFKEVAMLIFRALASPAGKP